MWQNPENDRKYFRVWHGRKIVEMTWLPNKYEKKHSKIFKI